MSWKILSKAPFDLRRRLGPDYTATLMINDGLGDFVLASGAVAKVQRHFGVKQCALVIRPGLLELARLMYPQSPLVTLKRRFSGSYFGMVADLFCTRLPRVSVFVCLRHHRGLFEELVVRRISAVRKVGIANYPLCLSAETAKWFNKDLPAWCPYPHATSTGSCLELEAHRIVVSDVLQREVFAEEVRPLIPTDVFDAQRESESDVVICPFTSAAYPMREYPTSQWVRALRSIQRTDEISVAVAVATRDRGRADEFMRCADEEGVKKIRVECCDSLEGLFRLLAKAEVVLSVDTLTAHLAAAMDKPSVIILGGGHPKMFGPWKRSGRQVWLARSLPCYGCHWSCNFERAHCVTDISIEAIAEAFFAAREAGRKECGAHC